MFKPPWAADKQTVQGDILIFAGLPELLFIGKLSH